MFGGSDIGNFAKLVRITAAATVHPVFALLQEAIFPGNNGVLPVPPEFLKLFGN